MVTVLVLCIGSVSVNGFSFAALSRMEKVKGEDDEVAATDVAEPRAQSTITTFGNTLTDTRSSRPSC
jgi:hypothetical protein